jgi:hypothetical protein
VNNDPLSRPQSAIPVPELLFDLFLELFPGLDNLGSLLIDHLSTEPAACLLDGPTEHGVVITPCAIKYQVFKL